MYSLEVSGRITYFKYMFYKRFFLFFLFLSSFLLVYSQLRYPIVGTYNKKSAQGMAIYGEYAFLFNDGGGCRKLNLLSGKIIEEFQLASSTENPHVNNACFGIERINSSQFPLLYISECKVGGFRCFVESIESTPRLVQTIRTMINGKQLPVVSWVVGIQEKALYAVTKGAKEIDSLGNLKISITKFRLPKVNEGKSIELTEKDMIERFCVYFPNTVQGAKIIGKNLYITCGLQQSYSHLKRAKRAIQVVDLEKKKLSRTIDLTYVTTNEPEDIDFYKEKCLLYCGQQGGIHEVQLK